MIGIGHHARQPRRIEHALLEIELPGAVLLRHQPALQPVGEPRHDALQMRELLVEIAAQPFQLVMVAEVFGRDHLVEFRREGVIFRPARLVGAARIRPRRLARRLVVAEFAVVEGVAGRGLRAFHRAFRHLVGRRLRLIGAHFLGGVGIGRALGAGLVVLAVAIVVLVLVLVGLGVAVVAEFERGQQVMHRIAELRLILGEAIEPVEPGADLVFQHRAPEVDHLAGGRGRRQPGQALAHQHRQRVGQRRVGAVGDLVELAAMEMIVEHRGEIFRDARPSAASRALRPGPARRPRTRRAPADFPASACDALSDRGRRASARSKSAWPRTIAASRRVILRAGSGSRALPGASPGRSAAKLTSSSGFFAIARRQAVTARLNGSVGASFDPVRNLELSGHFSSRHPSSRRTPGPITTRGHCCPEF